MRHDRPAGAWLAAFSAVALLAAGCDSRSGGAPSGDSGTATAPITGTSHPAHGSPITIGFVDDGPGPSHTPGQWTTAKAAAAYANDYLGGINGHVISLVRCDTRGTSEGGTRCGKQLIVDGAAIALAPSTGTSSTYELRQSLKHSGIAYLTTAVLSLGDIREPGDLGVASVIRLNVTPLVALAQIARDAGTKKVAFIAVADTTADGGALPFDRIFTRAGVKAQFIETQKNVDPTGQLREQLEPATGALAVLGSDSSIIAILKSLNRLHFAGRVVLGANTLTASMLASVPGGVAGVVDVVGHTSDPHDPDVRQYHAVLSKYAGTVTGVDAELGYISVLALVRALDGHRNATSAAAVRRTIHSMPTAVDMPLGGGITFRCGQKPTRVVSETCTTQYLQATLDVHGKPVKYRLADSRRLTS